MKAFIVLCLVAVFCAVQASAYDPLNQLKYQLDRAKSNIDSITRDIQRTTNLLEMNTNSKLSRLMGQSMSTANDIVNSALTDIRANVDAAKAEGKDVEACFTTVKNNLNEGSITVFQELKKCQQNGEQLLQVQLYSLEAQVAVGNKYTAELNTVFLNCYSSNINQMQSCIAIKLGTINRSIRTWETEVATQKRNAENGANQAYLSSSSCSMQAVSKLRSAATDIRIAASKCIKN